MESPRRRVPSEVLKRGYSDDELSHIYELGRFFLENGDLNRAQAIMQGLCDIAPDFAPAWLGMCYIAYQNKDIETAVQFARSALKAEAKFVEATLALVAGLISLGDYTSAGTNLGEIGELIDGGQLDDPKIIRFYKAQLMRFQNR